MWINLAVICITILLGLNYMQSEMVVLLKNKSVVLSKKIHSDRKLYIILICALLTLQSGLRNIAVGTDTYAYYNTFEFVKMLSWADVFHSFIEVYQLGIGKDPGYNLFQKIVQLLFGNYQVYLLLIAILFFSSLGYFIYKNTKYISEVMFAFVLYSALFYSFFSITGIRQTIATVSTLWGFELIKRKKFIPFLLIILIASTIHKSVLIFLPFYFLANFKKSKLIYTAAVLVFPLVMKFKNNIAYFMANLSGSENYLQFALSDLDAGTPTFTALMFLVVMFGWIFMKRALKINPELSNIYSAIALAFVFTPLTWVNPSLMRIVQYFSIFLLLFIPKIIDVATLFNTKIKFAIYFGIYFVLIILVIKAGGEYKFFWQEMNLGENYYW